MQFNFKERTDYLNNIEKFEYSFKGTFNPKLAAARNENYDIMNIYNSPPPNSNLYIYHYKINDSIFYQLKNGVYEFYTKNYDEYRKNYQSFLGNKLLSSANNKILVEYLKYDLELFSNALKRHYLHKDTINDLSYEEIELEGPRMDFVVDEVTGENYHNGDAIFKKKFYNPPHSYYVKKTYNNLIECLEQTIEFIETNLSHLGVDIKPKNLKKEPKKIFISYSKHDVKVIEDELISDLKILERQGKITIWYDKKLQVGDEWDFEIKKQLQEADVILFVVSRKFIATDYIWDEEIKNALKRHDNREAKVIPIILSPCDWTGESTPFSELQATPTKGKPITTFDNQDEAWLEVLWEIKRVID